jgi:hypothetical protein
MLRDSALEASHSAQRRINMVDGDSQMAQRLAGEKARQTNAHLVCSRLLSAANQYLFQLRLAPGYVLEPVVTKASPNKNETPQQAVERVRTGIRTIAEQLAAARRAPLKQQSRHEALRNRLASLALRAKPKLSFDTAGNVRILWAEDIATMDQVLGLLALCFPQELMEAFEIGDQSDAPNALTVSERDAAIAKLGDDLLALERIEAALLAQADGILPRPEMSPESYLQVRVAQQELQEEAQAVA